jgi:UDP-GlcNAc:undecaprenyl-phosphate/decaprenyl-phosphate GlcNAc-1-phosphate transferase
VRSASTLISILLTALMIVVSALAVLHPKNNYYPYMTVEVPANVSITFLLKARAREATCRGTIAALAIAALGNCPTCRIKQLECRSDLDASQREWLSATPLASLSMRLPGGVAIYAAHDPAAALSACRESQRLTKLRGLQTQCFTPGTIRTFTDMNRKISATGAVWAALALLAAGLASWLACLFIIRYERLHARFSFDPVATGPQSFHSVPAPRIGGLALIAGLLAGGAILLILQPLFQFDIVNFGYLLIAGAPAFLGGFAEDVTRKVKIFDRLVMTMMAGGMAAWLLGATLHRVSVPGLDAALLWLPFAVAFTVFAVSGVANAINIIDGYNGLASGFAVIVLLAMAWVAAQAGDEFILTSALILLGALLGFTLWNWPTGKIFLGDGGAYLVGFILAELSVLLVLRNPLVSPWFPMVLLGYPVLETLFTIYRRKFLGGRSPGYPDALHLHHLIYKHVICRELAREYPGKRNSRVAPYTLWAPLAFAGFAILFWQLTPVLITAVVVGSLLYVYVYRRIAAWPEPTMSWTTKHN